jgi:hypothetical protein
MLTCMLCCPIAVQVYPTLPCRYHIDQACWQPSLRHAHCRQSCTLLTHPTNGHNCSEHIDAEAHLNISTILPQDLCADPGPKPGPQRPTPREPTTTPHPPELSPSMVLVTNTPRSPTEAGAMLSLVAAVGGDYLPGPHRSAVALGMALQTALKTVQLQQQAQRPGSGRFPAHEHGPIPLLLLVSVLPVHRHCGIRRAIHAFSTLADVKPRHTWCGGGL